MSGFQRKKWLPNVTKALDFTQIRFGFRYPYGLIVMNQWIFALVCSFLFLCFLDFIFF